MVQFAEPMEIGKEFPTTKTSWAVLSDEQMSKRLPFSLLNDEQMSNKVGVEHQPARNQVIQSNLFIPNP